MNSASQIRVEKEEVLPLAVIYNGQAYGQALKEALSAQNLRVIHLEAESQALSVLEKPVYIFFFASKNHSLPVLKSQFDEARQAAKGQQAKIILILGNLDSFDENTIVGDISTGDLKILTVEIRGELEQEQLKSAVSKLVRLSFSPRDTQRQIIIGKPVEITSTASKGETVVPEVPPKKLPSGQGVNQKIRTLILGVSLVFLLAATLIGLIGASTLVAFSDLAKTKDYLLNGQFDLASRQAHLAKEGFLRSEDIVRKIAGPLEFIRLGKPVEKAFDILILGRSSAEAADHISQTAGRIMNLTKDFVSGSAETDIVSLAANLRGEIAPINQNLGLMQAQVLGVKTERITSILAFLGFPTGKLEKYISEIPQARKTLSSLESVLSILPEIVPAEGKRTYLVVFQNSAELRPTGGFIGSYGLVNFDQGKLVNWQIYDIYSADGQLRGQISPPDEILHYAGQPSWYMRDANWSPDWPLSAKRLEWFLEKETGQKVDGVIGISLGAVSKFMEATGPLVLPDLNETVDADNFFQKAEYSAEISFFPGSTQKKDYLGTVARALFEKIVNGPNNDLPKLGQALISALEEKDVIFYFNSATAQTVFSQNRWAGEIAPQDCQEKGDNCVSIVDANLGANKANYFVSKSIQVFSAIAKDGAIDTTITLNYKNASPSETWPGGKYKNYLRVLVPAGSKMTRFSLGDDRIPWVTPILTEKELAKVTREQFLVFQTMEGEYSSYGALLEVPIQSTRRVTFTFRHPYRLAISQENPTLTFNVIKQPGTGKDPLDFSVDFPSFLVPSDGNSPGASPLAIPQRLIYNSDLGTNKTFEIHFKRQI